MRRKSLRTFVQILLLGLLLGTSSSAHADAISMTAVSVTDIQLVPTSGTVLFFATQATPRGFANAVATDGFEGPSNEQQSPTLAQASINIGFAGASAVSDVTNMTLNANSNVMLDECVCAAESEGLAILRTSFMIVGGTGNVNVNLSSLLGTTQNIMLDQFTLTAVSETRISFQVFSGTTEIFSFDSTLRIGPTGPTSQELERQLSEILNLQFNTEYTLSVLAIANSRATQSEVPEPASVILLVSGLGFMARFVKKRRTAF
jgi:hypothetical protein